MFGSRVRSSVSGGEMAVLGGARLAGVVARGLAAVALTLAAAAALSGCAPSGDSAGTGEVQATLAETKSAAQLLRNEAASRLPDIIVKQVNETTDVSESCESPAKDPEGLSRSWLSTTSIMLTNSQSARITTVSEELAQSFVDQGWVESTEAADSQTLIALSNKSSLAHIEFSVEPKAEGQKPAIRIATTGPCVTTGGADSDEVRSLEGRD